MMTLDDVAQEYGINVIKCVFNDATHPVFEQVDASNVVAGLRAPNKRARPTNYGPHHTHIVWPNTLVMTRTSVEGALESPEDWLHELTHLVMASKFKDITDDDEGAGLLQLEWAIAQHLSPKTRKLVERYHYETVVDEEALLIKPTEWKRRRKRFGDAMAVQVEPGYRRTAWWKRGVQRAIELGVLEPNGIEPTWRRRQRA